MQSKLNRFSNNRIPVTRQGSANSNITPKGTVVGASPKEQQIQAAKAELAKSAGPSNAMPAPGAAAPSLGGKRLSPEQATYAAQGKGVAPAIAPAAPSRAPTAAETAQLTRAASSSAPDMNVMRNAAQPGPRAPVTASSAPVDRGPPMVAPGGPVNPGGPSMGLGSNPAGSVRPPMVAPGGPVNPGGPSMGLGSNPAGSVRPSMGPAPTMRTPVRPTSPKQMMKKGGQAKAYASGGSVKGAGIAQRGVRKCKMV